MKVENEQREQWSSRFGFIMTSAGAAIGLGNIWRFPYITGKYGGAAFVAFYILIAFTFGLALMMAEWAIGRAGKSDSVGSFKKLRGGFWCLPGFLGFIVAFVILSYYSVISGWIIYYIKCSLTGHIGASQGESAKVVFDSLVSNPSLCLALHSINMLALVAISIKGVSKGLERMCKCLIPALFVILLLLVVKSLTLADARQGVKFYLVPNFANLTKEGMMAATAQAFFSLSLASGAGITFGSYLNEEAKITRLAPIVVFFDTLAAFLAGLVIFPTCMATGVTPNSGPGLAFITLPKAFSLLPFGRGFAVAFFVLFYIAAITSAVSLLEVAVAYGVDQMKLSRRASVITMGLLIFSLGVPSALAGVPNAPRIFGKNFLGAADFIVSNWLIPLCAILICFFVGWVWTKGAKAEITNNGTVKFKLFPLWLFICRVVAPIILVILLITGGKW